jgi:protein TonB
LAPTPPRFDANYLDNPTPVYPALSRRLGEEGRVLLRVRVGPNGLPQNVDVQTSSGSPRLDLAAVDTVRRWKFVAARLGDEAIAASVVVPIVFSLKE